MPLTLTDKVLVLVPASEAGRRIPSDDLLPPGQVRRATLTELQTLLGGGVGVAGDFAMIQDQKANGTDGGTFTAGAWRTRDLNTEVVNEITGSALAANVLTLPAGTYRVTGLVPAFRVDRHQGRLQDTTNATTLVTGSTGYAAAVQAMTTYSILQGQFTLADTADVELQHQCQATRATDGFGLDGSFGGGEVYSQIELVKVA